MSSADHEPGDPAAKVMREALGYLNFSSGAPDGKFLHSLSELYELVEPSGEGELVDRVLAHLSAYLVELTDQEGAFADADQAQQALSLAKDFRDTYVGYHQDLLWGIDENELWGPFFLGRVFEAVLSAKAAEQGEASIEEIRDRFDDYIGYRPVAVLETQQKIEPYRNEWVRPIPLYIEGAGVAHGPYRELIEITLRVLRETDADLLRAAYFDPDALEELALDPRAYDFDHPVHKRPNHHFGQWDPSRIDQHGAYRRFVLQPIVIESLLARLDENGGLAETPREELLQEAGCVLAGTILMASGVSGSGPGAHSSEETLATLLPQIAEYRDRFYQDLMRRFDSGMAQRLREEEERMHQPLAGARQHLNQEIARRRALQLQQVHLARVFARMGRTEAALDRASAVRVASARMLCQIYCRLAAGHQAVDSHDLAAVAEILPQIKDLIARGVECGALVDPWNVVGFGGNFSLFPAIENTVRDYRVDDLIQIVEQLLGLTSRAWTEAAAVDDSEHERVFSEQMEQLSAWWDQFATPAVSGIRRLFAKEHEVSTNLVAGALNAWHNAGSLAGDIGFWGMFVDQFDTPKAFQLVIEALLEKEDHVASMALLMRWLCQVDLTPLEEGEASFHALAERWLQEAEQRGFETDEDQWPLVKKFFDHLEANAEEFWEAPAFEVGMRRHQSDGFDELLGDDYLDEDFDEDDESSEFDPEGESEFDFEEEEDEFGLYDAAYDEWEFEDSADDGMDSAIFEPPNDDTRMELEEEAQRLESRLSFLKTVARMWKHAAIAWGEHGGKADDRVETLESWRRAAVERYVQLGQLLETVHNHRLPKPRGDHESMVDFDRLRSVRDTIVEGVIETCVEMADAARLLRAAAGAVAIDAAMAENPDVTPDADRAPGRASGAAIGVLRAVLRGDPGGVAEHWDPLVRSLLGEELLYVPLAKGGDPRKIVRARALHRLVSDLVAWLPRLGLVRETCELLSVAQRMETEHPIGRGAVTEYDRLFQTGYEAIVRCMVASAEDWDGLDTGVEHRSVEVDSVDARFSDGLLVQALQDLTESQLERWLQHSRTVRLSVVERLASPRDRERFVKFVQRYGEDLFTQRFLTLSNLRAILHQSVKVWLEDQKEESGQDPLKLVDELDAGISPEEAERQLGTAIEVVVENYREYRDYNATTTQSDRGDMLFAFVDFLKLRNAYDRVAWNLKPVYLAHKILVRNGRPTAAELWRRAVAERTQEAADDHLRGLHDLSERYGMQLPTISERLSERFVRPLTIDRLRALVSMAMDDRGEPSKRRADDAFDSLCLEVDALAEGPTGAGLDLPDWVMAIEDEVSSQRRQQQQRIPHDGALQRIEQVRLDWGEAQEQLGAAGIDPEDDDEES